MFCPKCGSKAADDAVFCGNCGASLNRNAAVAMNSGTPPSYPSYADGASTTKRPKSGKRKAPFIIAIVVVAIAVLTIICVSIVGGLSAPDSGNEIGERGLGGAGSATAGRPGDASGVTVKDSTEAYTWEELSKISNEIAGASDENAAIEVAKRYNLCSPEGKLDGTQAKSVVLSDGTQTAVQIAGFIHDDKTGGGKAGITFIFRDCIGNHIMNPESSSGWSINNGGWEDSQMRSWLSTDGMALLPGDLKEVVVSVDKLTNNSGKATSTSSVTKTSDSLWLFSVKELAGSYDWSVTKSDNDVLNAEGNKYKLFRDMNIRPGGASAFLVKRNGGTVASWWNRSPNPHASTGFEAVNSAGWCDEAASSDSELGVVPGFCI